MNNDITHLTFLEDPTTYQPEMDEVYVRVPTGIMFEDELIAILKEKLGFPAYCGINWGALHEMLRHWGDWKRVPQRVVILHQDLPFLEHNHNGWFSLKTYLKLLIDSITYLQNQQAAMTSPAKERELVVIFPSHTSEDLLRVLNHPPVWQLSIGFVDRNFTISIDPSWSEFLHTIQLLNGVTAEVCRLSREDIGMIQVQYLKNKPGYYLHYFPLGRESELVASSDLSSSFPPVLSFLLTSQILETFFSSGERSSLVQWFTPTSKAYSSEAMLALSYYRSAEELLLEKDMNMPYETIQQGVKDAVDDVDQIFSLDYWKNLLPQENVPMSQRLTALCIIGMSDLPDALSLLRPFLDSPITEERWVSARFLGMVQDEHAFPVLLSMLTEEFPLKGGVPFNDSWYEFWRPYAPRLLRKWQTPQVTARLRETLMAWIEVEPLFNPDSAMWLLYELDLCYELGYRNDLSALESLTLEEEHRQELLKKMEQGARARRTHLRRA